jgi:hypothetical protein
MHVKYKYWPIKQLLIVSNSWGNPSVAQPLGHACPEKKPPGHFSLFFPSFFLFFSKKQKIEHRTEPNPVTYWTPHPLKAYPNPTGLNPVSVNSLRKVAHHFSPLARFKAACKKSADPTDKHYAPHAIPWPTSSHTSSPTHPTPTLCLPFSATFTIYPSFYL